MKSFSLLEGGGGGFYVSPFFGEPRMPVMCVTMATCCTGVLNIVGAVALWRMYTCTRLHVKCMLQSLYPGLPTPAFVSHPWRKSEGEGLVPTP